MTAHRLRANRAISAVSAIVLVAIFAACSPDDGDSDTGTDTEVTSGSSEAATQEPEPAEAVPLEMNAEGLLAGTATVSEYPPGDPGVLSVVETGPLDANGADSGLLPIVFRNNSEAAVSHVDVSATARDADGKLSATGTSQGTTPAQVPVGGLAMAYIYFDTAPAKDATYEFTFETSEADTSSYNTASLKVNEAELSGTTIVGTAVNHNDAAVQGPYSVAVYCFDDAGKLLSYTGAYADQSDEQPAGATVTFSADLYDHPCPTYLVGVTGYFA